MATNILTVTASGTPAAPVLMVVESLGPGFYGTAPVPVPATAGTSPDGFWIDLGDSSVGSGINELTAGSTGFTATALGFTTVGPDAANPLAIPYCYEVHFIDTTTSFGPPVSLILTTNAVNVSGFPAFLPAGSPLTVTAGAGVAHIVWTPGAGGGIWAPGPCCVHEDNRIQTAQGEKILIKDLRAGDRVIDMDGHVVPIVYNIKHNTPGRHFVKISKGALGKNTPETDLLVRAGHPILFEGQEKQVQDLVNEDTITRVELDEAAHVYVRRAVQGA